MFSKYQPIATFYFRDFCIFHCKILILVLGLQCSTRLATCNFSENELIAKFARVFTSLKLPGTVEAIILTDHKFIISEKSAVSQSITGIYLSQQYLYAPCRDHLRFLF